jgi:hypothetical protein
MSVVLPTDTFETIRPVLDRLLRQTVKHQLEVVLVAPSAEAVNAALAYREQFAGLQIVTMRSIRPLGRARAAGARAAKAPLVFIGETHAYPHRRFAEMMIRAHAGPWAAVTPAFLNGNDPKGAFSWSAFLIHYGRWAEGLPAGEIAEAPSHDVVFKREMLLELGDKLETAFDFGDEMPIWMRTRGHRVYFEPAGRIDHVNVSRPNAWARERFVLGAVIAALRARGWSKARRLAYVGGAVLIPVVLMWRIVPGVRRTIQHLRLPWTTLPLIVLGLVMQAAGELAGYAGVSVDAAEREMHDYEVNRLAYIGRGETTRAIARRDGIAVDEMERSV